MSVVNHNPAFAFVVNNILTTGKSVKILSKAKKESDINNESNRKRNATDADIQLVDEHGQVISNEGAETETTASNKPKNNSAIQRKNTKEKPGPKAKGADRMCLTKPDAADREKEKFLQSIATRGVVQLFNVVREKQQTLKHRLDEAGSSERKRVKVLTEFESETNELLEGDSMKPEDTKAKKNGRTKSNLKKNGVVKKKWSVLDDDYMTGKSTIKDWDKDSDNDDLDD